MAHYERVEVDVQFTTVVSTWQPVASLSMNSSLDLNPSVYLGIYEFPVARISAEFQPHQKSDMPYFVLVYQDLEGEVKFLELNPLTAFVIEQLQQNQLTFTQLLTLLKVQFPNVDPIALEQGLQQLLHDFAERSLL